MPRFNILPENTSIVSAMKVEMQLKKLHCTAYTALATRWFSIPWNASAVSAVKFPILYKVIKK